MKYDEGQKTAFLPTLAKKGYLKRQLTHPLFFPKKPLKKSDTKKSGTNWNGFYFSPG